MGLNPFQEGQNFEIERVRKTIDNEREASRNKGINALAETHGDAALAPQEFVAVTGSDRADTRLESDLSQRDIGNERNATQDANAEEDRQRKMMRENLGNIVLGMEAGLKSGADPQQIVQRFGPVLKNAFGVTDEELLALPQQMVDNPELIPQIKAALQGGSQGGRRATGKPITFKLPDGTVETRQFFNDGSFTTFDDGGVPIEAVNAANRIEVSQQNADTSRDKINPVLSSVLKSGERAGINLSDSVAEGLPEAQQLVHTVANGERALELINEGIRTGSFVDTRQGASRFFADIMGIEQEQIAETDEFKGLAGAFVAEQIKAFGAGTGLSDADREFAKGIVGGDIGMDAEAIKRLVTIQNKINKGKIKNYNSLRDAFIKRNPDFGEVYPNVRLPGEKGDRKVLKYNPETGDFE